MRGAAVKRPGVIPRPAAWHPRRICSFQFAARNPDELMVVGLVSLIDHYAFGDAKSFRAQRSPGDSQFAELKNRLKPVCHRTLRRQVLEYIRYTNRIPITQDALGQNAKPRSEVR
jgi:hypothetical protein